MKIERILESNQTISMQVTQNIFLKKKKKSNQKSK